MRQGAWSRAERSDRKAKGGGREKRRQAASERGSCTCSTGAAAETNQDENEVLESLLQLVLGLGEWEGEGEEGG